MAWPPWESQYGAFLDRLFTGDTADDCPSTIQGCGWPGLGVSYDSRTAIRQEIIERAPKTLSLALGAAVLWLIIGVSIGIISALGAGRPPTAWRCGLRLFGISRRCSGLADGLFIFWQKLGIQEFGTGYVNFQDDPIGWAQHLILPWFVLSLLYAASRRG